ncbi:MAG: hypothetical protein OK441_03895 [Thaumarchaeota archaeon]|nr:hypothetical protein [Nitrososphaerota archaeon]
MAGLVDLIVLLVALIIIWVIVSLPVYIAAKVVTKGKAEFGEAMWATLGGAIVYVIVVVGVYFFLGAVIGHSAGPFAVLLAFIAWLAFYRSVFEVGWLGAIGIAILAAIVVFILSVILVTLFGVSMPSFFHPF